MAITPQQSDLTAIFGAAPAGLADWLVIAPLPLCLITGAVLIMLRSRPGWQAVLAILGLAGLVVLDGLLLARVIAEGPVTMVMGRWLPPFGIAFTVDMTGALLALVAAIVALAGAIFSLGDIDASGRRHGFYPLLMLLMAGVTGAFLTGDIFNLYVWFEVLLVSSFGLMILGGKREQLDGAIKYGLLNLVATTLFLVATGYLYALFGTLNMADIARKAGSMPPGTPLLTLASLYLLAFGMKAAAFPVNFWLPASYHTPRVTVSALFAGLLTKVGIYALLRVLIMLFPAERGELAPVITAIAIATMLLGAFGALGQQDLRRLLGQIVISGIGIMLAGLALATPAAVAATIFYALHSMLVVSGLYFMAGIAAASGKSFSLNRLSGLRAASGSAGAGRNAVFAGLSLMLILAISGLPPFSGFWPKAMLVGEGFANGHGWLAGAILLSGFLTTLAMGRVFLLAYWRQLPEMPVPGRITYAMLAPLGIVTIPALVFGLWPAPLLGLAEMAAHGLMEPAPYIQSVFGREGF